MVPGIGNNDWTVDSLTDPVGVPEQQFLGDNGDDGGKKSNLVHFIRLLMDIRIPRVAPLSK